MIILSILVHLFFFLSVYDIYFNDSAKLVQNQFRNTFPAPAKRAVLIVCDGLRAEAMLNLTNNPIAPIRTDRNLPFLKSILKNHAAWGVGHTKPPTETQPGDVTIFAGRYEDPKQVIPIYKLGHRPVDSIFNQSRRTWCWGSTHSCTFHGEAGNTTKHVAHHLNRKRFPTLKVTATFERWLLDYFIDLIHSSYHNRNLNKALHKNQTLFTIFLQESDKLAENFGSNSWRFVQLLQTMDQFVEIIVDLMDDYFENDNATVYVLLADHGVLEKDGHGGNDSLETQIPWLAWGAGINKTIARFNATYRDRKDVELVDFSMLLATLLGINLPKDAIGRVPIELLAMAPKHLAEAAFTNVKQRLELYYTIRREKSCKYIIHPENVLSDAAINYRIEVIQRLMKMEQYKDMIFDCQELLNLTSDSIENLLEYHKRFVLLPIIISIILWICYALKFVTRTSTNRLIFSRTKLMTITQNVIELFLGLSIFTACYLILSSDLPSRYILYFTLPAILVVLLLTDIQYWVTKLKCVLNASLCKYVDAAWMGSIHTLSILLLIYSYFDRTGLSVVALLVGAWLLIRSKSQNLQKTLTILWIGTIIILGAFPSQQGVRGKINPIIVYVGGLCWIVFGVLCIQYERSQTLHSTVSFMTTVLVQRQTCLITLATGLAVMFRTGAIELRYIFYLRIISWLLVGISLVKVTRSSQEVGRRLRHIMLSLGVPSILLSVKHEAIFTWVLAVNMYIWMMIEVQLGKKIKKVMPTMDVDESQESVDFADQIPDACFGNINDEKDIHKHNRSITSDDFRRAYFFVFYLLIAFYGCINSDARTPKKTVAPWIWNFIGYDYNKYISTFLMCVKVSLPTVVVFAFIRAINFLTKTPPVKMMFLIGLYFDVISLPAIFMVKTKTVPWCVLGRSWVLFVIPQVSILVYIFFYGLAIVLTMPKYRIEN